MGSQVARQAVASVVALYSHAFQDAIRNDRIQNAHESKEH